MNVSVLAAVIIVIVLIDITIIIVHVAATAEPFVSRPPQHYPIVRCPDCHLVKQPPSECDPTAQPWAWDECVLVEYLNRNE